MKTVTIQQKMSNSGTIHDIASDQYDREIQFPDGHKYAIVLSSYYGDQYTTYDCEEDVIEEEKNNDYAGEIIDCDGNVYESNGYNLERLTWHPGY